MYLSRIEIENIRTCSNLQIDFESKAGVTLLSGNNGDGKSTVLRCIAIGLCDEHSAGALLRDLPGDFIKTHKNRGIIKIWLRKPNSPFVYKILTRIESRPAFEIVEQELFRIKNNKEILLKGKKKDSFPWHDIFLSGYGAGLRTIGNSDYDYYLAVDAVYTLFKYDVTLQNPELSFRRIVSAVVNKAKDSKQRRKRFTEITKYLSNTIERNLNFDTESEISLEETTLKLGGKKRTKIGLGSQGDGVRAITTLTLDILSWWMLYQHIRKKDIYHKKERDAKGVVIIDEVEQHLHPKWQKEIVHLLTNSFPGIQFILTTHSPLVLSSYGKSPIYVLKKGQCEKLASYGWRPEDVYEEIMGLETTRSKVVQDKIDRFNKLHRKYLSDKIRPEEKVEFNILQKELNGIGGPSAQILQEKIKNFINQAKKIPRKK